MPRTNKKCISKALRNQLRFDSLSQETIQKLGVIIYLKTLFPDGCQKTQSLHNMVFTVSRAQCNISQHSIHQENMANSKAKDKTYAHAKKTQMLNPLDTDFRAVYLTTFYKIKIYIK